MDDSSFETRDVIRLGNPEAETSTRPSHSEEAANAAVSKDARHPEQPAPAGVSKGLTDDQLAKLTDDLIEQLKLVYDPEIPVDIYELGLIYRVDVSDDLDVVVDMTLTAPGCPVAGEMPGWVKDACLKVEGVRSCDVNLVFEPPWDPSKMSDEARLQLNMF